MCAINLTSLEEYRARTFRLLPGTKLKSQEEAVEYVNELGFVYFWPIRDITLPSLWVATAGDRPVADAHDDPGHVTWGWKDSLLGSRAWYYSKILRKRGTMVSMELVPYFYALSENFGAPDEDYLTQYEQGKLTQEAKTVYETILREGPLDTPALRRASRMSSSESNGRFSKALSDLQADFKIVPTAVTDAGAWHYAFAYDAVHRCYPELPDLAHPIGEKEARRKLAETYLHAVGAAQLRDLTRLFGWRPPDAERAVEALVQQGVLCRGLELDTRRGEWFALRELT